MKVIIFGATGSIGQQVIEVLSKNKKNQVVGFSYFSNQAVAKKITKQYPSAKVLHSSDKTTYQEIEQFINELKPDMIINAISGVYGLNYSLVSVNSEIDLLLANKESLVMCGRWLMPLAMRKPGKVYPIDSEHTALYLLLKYKDPKKKIKDYYITASGGRYFKATNEELKKIKYKDAINHPNWKMGEKISIDSATLINKAFEVVEAYWLFNQIRVKVLLEPTSHLHALIEYDDGSIDAFISEPTMLEPITYALNKFEGVGQDKIKHFKSIKDLPYPVSDIKKTNLEGMKYVDLIFKDLKSPIASIICAADEYAIELYRNNKIGFCDIYKTIDNCITKFKDKQIDSFSDTIQLTSEIRSFIKK